MGAPLSEAKKRSYWAYIRAGMSNNEASRRAGFHPQTGKALQKGVRSMDSRTQRALKESDADPGPIPLDQLSPEAQRALDDIAYFALRYFGFIVLPWQQEATARIVALQTTIEEEYAVINCPPGSGKALALDTPIPTPSGWTTMKDLAIGDEVLDEQGNPCRVTRKSEVFYDHDCYEVRTDDGASVVADADHLWPVRLHGEGQYKRGPKAGSGVRAQTTAFLAKTRSKRPQLPVTAPLNLPHADLPIDPYTLGVWLGDGDSSGPTITAAPEDAVHIRREIEQAGYRTYDKNQPMRFHLATGEKWERPTFKALLASCDLLDNKHIPPAYLRASAAQRLALLQGLIDTDGYVSLNGHIEFSATNKRLALSTLELVRSLGVKANMGEGRATMNGKDCGPKYRVTFYLANAARLPRKAAWCRNAIRTTPRYLTVTPCESVPTQCIEVDSPNHLYLAGEGFLVTHNSTFFTLVLPAWMTCRNRAIRGLIGSAAMNSAKWYIGRLKTFLSMTQPNQAKASDLTAGIALDAVATLVDDFGSFKPKSDERWAADAFTVRQHGDRPVSEKENTWMAFGRSSTFLGARVDFCIWDDVYDPQQLRTVESKEQLREWWDGNCETRLEPGGLLILQGQRKDASDIYRYALDKKAWLEEDADEDTEPDENARKYHHIIFKAHYEDRCTGRHGKDSLPYPEGCLLYPRRLSYRKLMGIKVENNATFEIEYQQEDTAASDVLVDKIWVSGGTAQDGSLHFGCWDSERGLCQLPANVKGPLFSVATIDPSPKKYWGIHWYVYAPEMQHQVFLMDIIRAKLRGNEVLDWLENDGKFVGVMQDWQERSRRLGVPIRHWIIEANAAQAWFYSDDKGRRWTAEHAVTILEHVTTGRKNDPEFGVYMLREPWRTGRIRLPGRTDARIPVLKLVDEVTRYPHGGTDDQVMSQWFLFANMHKFAVLEAPDTGLRRPAYLKSITDSRRLLAVS